MTKKDYTTEELINIKNFISQYETLGELKHDLDIIISRRKKSEKKSLNTRFSIELMKQLRILDQNEYIILNNNHIHNLQELRKSNLDNLGFNNIEKEKIEWVRQFYDMSSLEEKKRK